MLNAFKLSIRFFWRESLRGQWNIVFLALIISVGAISALNFYADRVARGIEKNNATFLGGNLIVESSNPIPINWLEYAKQLNIQTAEVWSYPTVVTVKQKMQLVNLFAVSDNYPLLGKKERPQLHSIWVEPRLLTLLSTQINESVNVGAAQFKMTKVLQNANAIFDSGWLIAPRAMILINDVPATKTVIQGSRVSYKLLLLGENKSIEQFKTWIKPQLKSSQHLIDVKNQELRLTNIIEQVENFLKLALLICLALSCLAIILSIQQYLT